MEIFLFRRHPGKGRSGFRHRAQTEKAACFPVGNRSFSVYETPADQCVECVARRRILFRKAVVRLRM
jgi:hypothetical protein